MDDQRRGLRTCSKAPNSKHLRRQRDDFVRSNTKTSIVATVCGSHGLQPFLPQLLFVRTTRNATPPAHLPNAFAATGEPLEYDTEQKAGLRPKPSKCRQRECGVPFAIQHRGVDPSCVGLFPNAPEHRCDTLPTAFRHFSYSYTGQADITIASL